MMQPTRRSVLRGSMQAKLRSQGMRHIYALGVEVSTNGVDPLATFNAHLIANGGKDLVTPDGQLHADDPQVREAVIKTLTRFSKLFKDGYVPPGVVNWNDQDNNNSFHSKEIVLCFNGFLSIELAQIDQKAEYEDQVTRALPLGNDGKPLPAQIGEFGVVIPKGAQNVAVAKEFLKYAIEPKVLNEYLKGGLGRWAIPYPEVVKTDPFWLHSGDQHRTTYITETLVGPTMPLYEAYSPAAAKSIPSMSFRWPGMTSSTAEWPQRRQQTRHSNERRIFLLSTRSRRAERSGAFGF
jgi:multiple sugar transport system substrate-binding protein